MIDRRETKEGPNGRASAKCRGRVKFLPVIFFLLFGCTPAATLPKWTGYELLSGKILERFLKEDHKNDTFKAFARVEIDARGRKYPLRIAMMLKRPSLVRIESFPVIGPPDLFLTINEKALKFHLPQTKEFYTGKPLKENLAAVIPVSLDPAEMLSVLIGIPPITEVKPGYKESMDGGRRRYYLFSQDNRVQSLSIDGDNGRLREIEIFTPYGETIYRVIYGDYRKVGNADLPQQITILMEEAQSKIVVRYSDMEFDAKGDEFLFDLPVPEDAHPVHLDGGKAGSFNLIRPS